MQVFRCWLEGGGFIVARGEDLTEAVASAVDIGVAAGLTPEFYSYNQVVDEGLSDGVYAREIA